eukprot:46050-Amphidinium_carterae.1
MSSGLHLAPTIQEVEHGTLSHREIQLRLGAGQWDMQISAAVDARSVFTAVTANDIKVPSERHLHYLILAA